MRTPISRRGPRAALAAAAAASLLALGACSGGSSDDRAAAESDVAAEAPVTSAPHARDNAFGAGDDSVDTAGEGPGTVSVTLESPDLIKTANVSIVEEDLGAARDTIDELLRKYGGVIADEKTNKDTKGKTETSTLVIRVPARSFADIMADIDEGLDVRTSTTNTEDVHTEVIDVESRLANLRVSLSRLRTFLRNSSDLNAMLQFEQRITNVESQIASLTAQREYLNDQTTMSTITLELRTPAAPPPKPKKDDPLAGAGFFSGLEDGWNALKDVLLVVATVVGALIPFAAVGLVLGFPAWLLLRRRPASTPVAVDEVGQPS